MYTMIVDGEYPSDIRVRKEAESLSLSGVEIQVVTRWKRGQEREEKINGVTVLIIIRTNEKYTLHIIITNVHNLFCSEQKIILKRWK